MPKRSRRPSSKPARRRATAAELQALIAQRAGVPEAAVLVRGTPPHWDVIAIPRTGQRASAILVAAIDLQAEYDLVG